MEKFEGLLVRRLVYADRDPLVVQWMEPAVQHLILREVLDVTVAILHKVKLLARAHAALDVNYLAQVVVALHVPLDDRSPEGVDRLLVHGDLFELLPLLPVAFFLVLAFWLFLRRPRSPGAPPPAQCPPPPGGPRAQAGRPARPRAAERGRGLGGRRVHEPRPIGPAWPSRRKQRQNPLLRPWSRRRSQARASPWASSIPRAVHP
mmetsp:Transcript_29664/g.93547  ORF Transcript_29664/g.93547 Transcript_29664/m.93547 type:complete len:205 (-) Transcript_29664:145-759(-)